MQSIAGGARFPASRVEPVEGTCLVAGLPRSGTTLLEQMLDRHPAVGGIGEFEGVTVKPNHLEAARACGDAPGEVADLDAAMAHGRALAARAGRPVFLTLGKLGILACTADRADHAPAPPVRGPIDIVGAGDSVAAGIVAALCAGADPLEAARFGNLCASVTIHKLGTTGTASPDELRRALAG